MSILLTNDRGYRNHFIFGEKYGILNGSPRGMPGTQGPGKSAFPACRTAAGEKTAGGFI